MSGDMSKHPVILAPSILAGNHASLLESLQTVDQHRLKWLHLDIMDGHFVPNLTFGPQTLADLRKHTHLFFDTHLMLDNPHEYLEAFAKAGADQIIIHVEPQYPIRESLQTLKKLGCKTGISLNPPTPAEAIEPYLDQVDLVLAMTVQPGFGGQAFDSQVLDKIQIIHRWREERGYAYRLEVDGGINAETAQDCKKAGADTLVAGSAFFKSPDKARFIEAVEKND